MHRIEKMMRKYEACCDCGFRSRRYVKKAYAQATLDHHVCPPVQIGPTPDQRCGNCGGWFWALVDGELCIRCDSLLLPSTPIPRTPVEAPAAIGRGLAA